MSRQKTFEVVVESLGDFDPKFPRPRDIEIDELTGTAGKFGKYEVEKAAGRLVEFMRTRGNWIPFTLPELYRFYEEQGWNPGWMFFGLMGVWGDNGIPFAGIWRESEVYLVVSSDARYYVTEAFIKRLVAD